MSISSEDPSSGIAVCPESACEVGWRSAIGNPVHRSDRNFSDLCCTFVYIVLSASCDFCRIQFMGHLTSMMTTTLATHCHTLSQPHVIRVQEAALSVNHVARYGCMRSHKLTTRPLEY